MTNSLADELRRIAKGEILYDSWSRDIYSVDASHYTIKPSMILCPLDESDIERICQYCFSKSISMTARGAGTGLLGQSLSDSIIIDFTRNMNKVLEIGTDYVIVQPGLVKGILDKELKRRGKFFPPDPASQNYCTIGGMIANNSSGAHCLAYGNTIDLLQELRVVYSDGSSGLVNSNSHKSEENEGSHILADLLRLLSTHKEIIQKGYPRVTKNSCGYRLDKVIDNNAFFPHKLFAASEGTLGMVTCAKLKIIDIPLYRYLTVAGFKDLLSALSFVPLILKFSPVALELLDSTVVRHGVNNNISSTDQQLQSGNDNEEKGCLLFIEFAGDRLVEVEQKFDGLSNKLSDQCTIIESAADEQSLVRMWGARRNALNQATKMTVGSRKPLGLIEDTVVHPYMLNEHAQQLLQMYSENKLDYVIYGHAGDGNLHTRPLIDLGSQVEVRLFNLLANQVFQRVIRSGGTITGEHGDGLARVKYIESVYGSRIYSLFREIKSLFDPRFIMNPGKKIVSNSI
jgi:glycolate dehydrogenase FAD-linked subunit